VQEAQSAAPIQSSDGQPVNQISANQVPASQTLGSQPSNQSSVSQPASAASTNSSQSAAVANFLGSNAAPAVIVAANPGSTGSRSTGEVDGKKTTGKVSPDKTFTDRPAPAEKQADVATLAASGTSRIAQVGTTQQPAPEVAPSFTVVDENTGAPLTSLARPSATSAPTAAALEQSQLEPLQLIRAGTPVYPAIAKARSITGVAVVQGTVGKDGRVTNLKFISGQPIFRDAAFDAARQYQFKPAKLNGQPIEQTTQIKISFH
jgi:TonB family protein